MHGVHVGKKLEGCLDFLRRGIPVEAAGGLLGRAEVDRETVSPHFFRQFYRRKHLLAREKAFHEEGAVLKIVLLGVLV